MSQVENSTTEPYPSHQLQGIRHTLSMLKFNKPIPSVYPSLRIEWNQHLGQWSSLQVAKGEGEERGKGASLTTDIQQFPNSVFTHSECYQ